MTQRQVQTRAAGHQLLDTLVAADIPSLSATYDAQGAASTAQSAAIAAAATDATTKANAAQAAAIAASDASGAAAAAQAASWPATTAFDATTPAAIGTGATGSAAKAAHRDHVHATGAGTPSTQAFGDAAATGTGPAAAMTDHKHAMMAAPTSVSGNAGTVTTNANLTGDVTSVGNATTLTAAKAPQAYGRTVHGGTTDYSVPGIIVTATGTTAQIANNLVYQFHYTPTPITIDQVAFVVTTGPASNANVRVGIYNADTSWQPSGNPLADVTVAVASAFTGIKTISAAATINGRFIIAFNMDVAMSLRQWTGSNWVGAIDSALGTSNYIEGASVASTYGAMPAPGTAWTVSLQATNGNIHPIVVRISVP